MRKRIRLTGRKQLPRNAAEAWLIEEAGKRAVFLRLGDMKEFASFPASARLKLRLSENKMAETLEFGALGAPLANVLLKNESFQAPSCQFRVVASEGERKGLLLGSTDTWTLRATNKDQDGNSVEGILLFQPFDIAPLTWKLDIREDDYPIVYVDRSIPDSQIWVKNDPIFISCVLPVIIRDIFTDILSREEQTDVPWIKDWLGWAETHMPGAPPPWLDDKPQKLKWVEQLVESFCADHNTLKRLVDRLLEQAPA